MKYSFIIFLFSTLAFAQNLPFNKELLDIQAELTPAKYEVEYKIYTTYLKDLKELETTQTKIYADKQNRIIFLNKLQQLQKESNSLIIASILLNKTVEFVGIANKAFSSQYLEPTAEILYRKKICQGYIFKGETLYSLHGKLKESVAVYKEGLNECTAEKNAWKNFAILSRYNNYSYKLEKKSDK